MDRIARPTGSVGLSTRKRHDACGVAFVARVNGVPTHETVSRAIVALDLEHRSAAGADPNTGDGSGILLQLPDAFLRAVLDEELPPGAYGVAVCFLPQDARRREELERLLTDAISEGQRVVCWRDVPVDKDYVGITGELLRAVHQAARGRRVGRPRDRPRRLRAQACS